MRILISMRDFRIPPNNFLFDCLERSWYSFLGNHHLIPHANTRTVDETIDFDCLVLSGGSDSVARNVTENLLFVHAIKRKKPILGICHGAFVVNELSGGKNQIDWNIVPTHENSEHEVTMDGKKVLVNSYHGQTITQLGPQMVPLAMHEPDQTIEAFKHQALPIYGIVWHPERMEVPVIPEEVAILLK
jgi:GMP synthase-like glutamine amidotransferase